MTLLNAHIDDEHQFSEALAEALEESDRDGGEDVSYTSQFSDGGMMTRNEGFTVRLKGGAEFQVTVVQSRMVGE